MIVYYHNEEYFEKTPIEKQRVCCNCNHRMIKPSQCDIDEHYIGYVSCFEAWCKHWAAERKNNGKGI